MVDGEAWNDFWPTEIYRRCQDYKYLIGCHAGEIYRFDGDRDLSDACQVQHDSQCSAKKHYNITIWHKFIPMPQAMKIPAAEAAADKNGRNMKRFLCGI